MYSLFDKQPQLLTEILQFNGEIHQTLLTYFVIVGENKIERPNATNCHISAIQAIITKLYIQNLGNYSDEQFGDNYYSKHYYLR